MKSRWFNSRYRDFPLATILKFCTKFRHGTKEFVPNFVPTKFRHSKFRPFQIPPPPLLAHGAVASGPVLKQCLVPGGDLERSSSLWQAMQLHGVEDGPLALCRVGGAIGRQLGRVHGAVGQHRQPSVVCIGPL